MGYNIEAMDVNIKNKVFSSVEMELANFDIKREILDKIKWEMAIKLEEIILQAIKNFLNLDELPSMSYITSNLDFRITRNTKGDELYQCNGVDILVVYATEFNERDNILTVRKRFKTLNPSNSNELIYDYMLNPTEY